MLFPHLSVIDNVAFGPRVSGLSRQKSRERAESWLERVGALEFVARRPNQLSGGQAQRVALARALAAEPRLLLLDEPMAALDIAVAPLLRRVLAKVLAGRTTMIVTHDLLDALLLSDRIVVLQEGKVVEDGPTDEVLTHPRTSFTARIAGLNLVRGRFRDGCVVDEGLAYKGFPKENEDLPDEEARAAAVFPPSAVSIHTAQPEGSPRNTVRVTVAELEPHGELVRVRGDDGRGHVLSSDVTGQSVAELDLYPGREVVYAIKAAAVTVFAL
jgi:molybdate transport system ATP-binding protein